MNDILKKIKTQIIENISQRNKNFLLLNNIDIYDDSRYQCLLTTSPFIIEEYITPLNHTRIILAGARYFMNTENIPILKEWLDASYDFILLDVARVKLILQFKDVNRNFYDS